MAAEVPTSVVEFRNGADQEEVLIHTHTAFNPLHKCMSTVELCIRANRVENHIRCIEFHASRTETLHRTSGVDEEIERVTTTLKCFDRSDCDGCIPPIDKLNRVIETLRSLARSNGPYEAVVHVSYDSDSTNKVGNAS